MKLHVFLRSFGGPFLLLILLIIQLANGLSTFHAFEESVFIASLVFSRLLGDDRYLKSFAVFDERLFISSFNQFLKETSADFSLSEIENIRLSKRVSFAAIWSPVLRFKVGKEWSWFYIISKDLYMEIRNYLQMGGLTPSKSAIK